MDRDPLEMLKLRLRRFTGARGWDRCHSPKNLSMALAAETAALLERFQWLSEGESANLPPAKLRDAELELADVLVVLVRLADKLEVNLIEAVDRRLMIYEQKYPAQRTDTAARLHAEPAEVTVLRGGSAPAPVPRGR